MPSKALEPRLVIATIICSPTWSTAYLAEPKGIPQLTPLVQEVHVEADRFANDAIVCTVLHTKAPEMRIPIEVPTTSGMAKPQRGHPLS